MAMYKSRDVWPTPIALMFRSTFPTKLVGSSFVTTWAQPESATDSSRLKYASGEKGKLPCRGSWALDHTHGGQGLSPTAPVARHAKRTPMSLDLRCESIFFLRDSPQRICESSVLKTIL